MDTPATTPEPLPTTERLARALEATGDPALAGMIMRARAGYYDDFKSPLAMPERQLVIDLRQAGQTGLLERAMDGEFDSTAAESQAWAASEDGQNTFRELFGR